MSAPQRRVLVAGIGNIFLGDDAFGVEVVRRIVEQQPSPGVCVRDFGIRGFDLAYALGDGWETVVLVDALSRGEAPGTIFVLEPSSEDLERGLEACTIQPHGMDPLQAIRLARSLGELPRRLLVVGCEPGDLGGEDGCIGLSPAVEAAIGPAVQMVRQIMAEALAETRGSKEQEHEMSSSA